MLRWRRYAKTRTGGEPDGQQVLSLLRRIVSSDKDELTASFFVQTQSTKLSSTEAATVLLRTLLFTLYTAFSFRRHKVVPSTEAMDVLAQLEHDGLP